MKAKPFGRGARVSRMAAEAGVKASSLCTWCPTSMCVTLLHSLRWPLLPVALPSTFWLPDALGAQLLYSPVSFESTDL